MYVKYTITIEEIENQFYFSIKPEDQTSYQAQYSYCLCKVIYTRPIVILNTSTHITILVCGKPRVGNRISVIKTAGFDNLLCKLKEISILHEACYRSIKHSLSSALNTLKDQYGRSFSGAEGFNCCIED